MSLVTGVIDARFGFWKLPETQRKRYLERLYQAFLILNHRFHEQYTAGRIPADRILFVHYDRMMRDFEGLMTEIADFTDVELNPAQLAEIKKTGEKQRAWKSKHAYDLEKFGLDEARILRDYAFFYETFGLDATPST